MLKRKEFMLGAVVGLGFAAAATAGGVIEWPGAVAQDRPAARAGQLIPTSGAAGMAFAPPPGAPLSFADIFDQVAPAVVQIDVKTRTPRSQLPGGGMGGLERLLPFPFNQLPQQAPQGEDGEDEGIEGAGSGSGFFISADGYIVTNNHVVQNAEEITVKLTDEREFTATIVGRDEGTDLAVLKVEGGSFPFVSFEESAEPRVGDWVVAVGNPFSLGGTATAGIVSAKSRDIDPQGYNDYIQIDAAINRGNSGGPTFDIYGRVIGVNTAIFSPTGGSVGIGFAIPASVAKQVTDTLMRGGSIERGYLGVSIGNLLPDYKEALGLDADFEGAFINSVTPGGPADRAGVQAGDVVVSVNGESVESSTEVTRLVGRAREGETIRIEILRDNRRQTINVTSGKRPSTEELNRLNSGLDGAETPNAPGAATGTEVAGLRVTPITPALRERYSIPAGVNGIVVTGTATGGDVRFANTPGVVILRAGTAAVSSVADLQAAVAAARQAGRDSVFLLVRLPNGQNSPVVLELPDAE
ncbi:MULTISPECIES: Do family serine endopeptidase [Brevundimonas]|uniref:Do family serine endopeptidase n=1 Tax=Brevundimonas TaxID=41275 RepID=UPI000F029EE3|nr:Do family serine endopeptidase [Brevundimonas lutea]